MLSPILVVLGAIFIIIAYGMVYFLGVVYLLVILGVIAVVVVLIDALIFLFHMYEDNSMGRLSYKWPLIMLCNGILFFETAYYSYLCGTSRVDNWADDIYEIQFIYKMLLVFALISFAVGILLTIIFLFYNSFSLLKDTISGKWSIVKKRLKNMIPYGIIIILLIACSTLFHFVFEKRTEEQMLAASKSCIGKQFSDEIGTSGMILTAKSYDRATVKFKDENTLEYVYGNYNFDNKSFEWKENEIYEKKGNYSAHPKKI